MTARIIMKMRVRAMRLIAKDVLLITLGHDRRPQLPEWTPGAHVDFHLPEGRIRQYSLCGDPTDRTIYQIAVKREETGRGGSKWIHANLAVDAQAHVSAPRNNFPLAPAAARHVMVAGGIGVTPFVAMTRALARAGCDFDLQFCARSAPEAPLLEELRALCGDRLQTWFSSEGRRFNPRVLEPVGTLTHYYTCGPQSLLETVTGALAAAGCADDRVHAEVFQPTLDENFKPEPFDARILSTNEIIHVPADRSLLDMLREHGYATTSSCELGVCGSCICGYRDGIAIHRDSVLSVTKRQDSIAPCVSRARVSISLDM